MVFCEVDLADGSGIDLYASLDDELKERFVFITSGVLASDTADFLARSGQPTFIKPLSMIEVSELLADAARGSKAAHPAMASTLSERDDDGFAAGRRAERMLQRRQADTASACPSAKLND